MVTPMTPWLHVRHALLMQATCDCAWLLTMPIVATMRGHRSLPLLDRSHYDPLEPCAPGEFRVFESVGQGPELEIPGRFGNCQFSNSLKTGGFGFQSL